jgi:hypothetical protein
MGLADACFLLGADCGQFALDVGADGSIGPESLQASRELVAVEVKLTGGELPYRAAVAARHGQPALRGRPARQSRHRAWPAR